MNKVLEEKMDEKKVWKSFWFEGNMAWGQIKSAKDWERIKKAYDNNVQRLRRAQRCEGSSIDYFGFAPECKGFESLGEFADKNGMQL